MSLVRLIRVSIAVSPLALLAALPQLAPAATFCVHAPPECAGTAKSTLQQAFDATAANGAGRDEIQLGVGLFNDGPAVDAVGNPVDLIGVATNQTAIYSSSTTAGLVILDIEEPTTEVRHLRVHHNSAAPSATGIVLAGDADDVLVTNQGVSGQFDGVKMIGSGSSFENGSVQLIYPKAMQNHAILVAAGATSTIALAVLEGSVGVLDQGVGATILNSRIRADQGVVASGGAATKLRDTQIRVPGTGETEFQVAALAAAGAGTTKLEANRVTAYGKGSGYGAWVSPNGGAGNNASIELIGSVLDGFQVDVNLGESGGANASLSSKYSAYDSTKLSIGAGTAHTQGAGKVDLAGVDPHFADAAAGDFMPLWDSPLVDAGDPTYHPFIGLDSRLQARVLDGDSTPGAVVDIGAIEYQHRPPKAVAEAPAGGDVSVALGFNGLKSSDPDEESLIYSWSFDDGTHSEAAYAQKAFSTPGQHTGTLTVTDPSGLSDTVSVTVDIAAPGLGPTGLTLEGLALSPRRFRVGGAGTHIGFTLSQAASVTFTVHRAKPRKRWKRVGAFTRSAGSGANSLTWKGRIGKRVLQPGRYRLTAQARAADGSLSPPRAARFRVRRR